MDTTSLIPIPGYRYHEYLVVLEPRKDFQEAIQQIRRDFERAYRVSPFLYWPPHLGLVSFVQMERKERPLKNRLERIAAAYHPFSVSVRDFGSIPCHSILLHISSRQEIQQVTRELRAAQDLMSLDKEYKPHFMDDPYFLIARKLLPWQYEQGWKEYSQRNFTGSFIATGFSLIRRPLEGKVFRLEQRFEFKNLPVIRQSELFD